jgi:hypothetical protein
MIFFFLTFQEKTKDFLNSLRKGGKPSISCFTALSSFFSCLGFVGILSHLLLSCCLCIFGFVILVALSAFNGKFHGVQKTMPTSLLSSQNSYISVLCPTLKPTFECISCLQFLSILGISVSVVLLLAFSNAFRILFSWFSYHSSVFSFSLPCHFSRVFGSKVGDKSTVQWKLLYSFI